MLKNKPPNGKILKLLTVNDPSKLKSKVCKNDKILLALLPVQNIYPPNTSPQFPFHVCHRQLGKLQNLIF